MFLFSIVTPNYQTPKDDENSDNNTNNEQNRSRYLKHIPDNNIYLDNSQTELSPLTSPEVPAPPVLELPHIYPKVPTEQKVNAISPPNLVIQFVFLYLNNLTYIHISLNPLLLA